MRTQSLMNAIRRIAAKYYDRVKRAVIQRALHISPNGTCALHACLRPKVLQQKPGATKQAAVPGMTHLSRGNRMQAAIDDQASRVRRKLRPRNPRGASRNLPRQRTRNRTWTRDNNLTRFLQS